MIGNFLLEMKSEIRGNTASLPTAESLGFLSYQAVQFGCIVYLQKYQNIKIIFCLLFGRLECVAHSFAYVAPFVFLRDVWVRTQRDVVASRRASNLATHLPKLAPISLLSHLSFYLATHLPA